MLSALRWMLHPHIDVIQSRHDTPPAVNWLHFGYDGSYTSYNPVESTISITNVAQLERKWGISCDDVYFSVISRSPAIYTGKLYTSGAGSRLTAYDARTGRMLWQFAGGDPTDEQIVNVFEVLTGQMLRRESNLGNADWALQPVVSEDGMVFYMEGSNPTHLYAVDADNGDELWEAPFGFDMSFNDKARVSAPRSLISKRVKIPPVLFTRIG